MSCLKDREISERDGHRQLERNSFVSLTVHFLWVGGFTEGRGGIPAATAEAGRRFSGGSRLARSGTAARQSFAVNFALANYRYIFDTNAPKQTVFPMRVAKV